MILMDVLSVAEFVFPPPDSLQHKDIVEITMLRSQLNSAPTVRVSAPHPVQTVRAAEELLDELVVRQAGDVGGSHGDLTLPSNGDGFVSGGEGFLPRWRSLLL